MGSRVDGVVVGGGLVGSIFACEAASRGASLVIIDRSKPRFDDDRAYAISYSSFKTLESLGIWSLLPHKPQPIRMIRVSQGHSNAQINYHSTKSQEDPLGFMVPAAHLRRAVFKRTQEHPGITWRAPCHVEAVSQDIQGASLALSKGETLSAPLLIAADGRHSALREQLKIRTVTRHYQHAALICTLKHTKPHDGIAFEHFLPSGPIALLPLSNNCSALVWTDSPERTSALQKIPEDHFIEALMTRFGQSLGALQLITPRITYPLSLVWCPRVVCGRTVFIGDAAHVIHPVAGQGLNVGIRDAQILGAAVGEAVALGMDTGNQTVLKLYQKQRRSDVWSMTAITHGLIHLFGLSGRLARGIRGVGMNVIENSPSLKQHMITYASRASAEKVFLF